MKLSFQFFFYDGLGLKLLFNEVQKGWYIDYLLIVLVLQATILCALLYADMWQRPKVEKHGGAPCTVHNQNEFPSPICFKNKVFPFFYFIRCNQKSPILQISNQTLKTKSHPLDSIPEDPQTMNATSFFPKSLPWAFCFTISFPYQTLATSNPSLSLRFWGLYRLPRDKKISQPLSFWEICHVVQVHVSIIFFTTK